MKLIDVVGVALAVGCLCTMGGQDVAGTSEQGNARVTATVVTSTGIPAEGATVRLREAGYIKVVPASRQSVHHSADVFTDATGSFSIDSLDTGSYSIEVTDTTSEAVLLRCTIDTLGTFNLSTSTLRPFATIKGKIESSTNDGQQFVQVEGLERLVKVADDGSYLLSDLPAGTLTLRSISENSSVDPVVIPNIITQPAHTTLAPFNGWLFSQPVYLNTTTSGADITTDVYGFPILVRLNATTFNFDEANSDGTDIRFIKADADSTPVPFEIERWNPVSELAEVWVTIDTVYGNNKTQSVIMLWGNTTIKSAHSLHSAFDTADGFGAVWHLSGNGTTQAMDATPNEYNGVPTAVEDTEGVIGGAGMFVSTNKSYITMPNTATGKLNFSVDGNYSVSAWVNADSGSENRGILSKGDVQYYLKIHDLNWRFSEYHELPEQGWEITQSPYSFGNWVHLYGVRNGTAQYLYVDGVCVDTVKDMDEDEALRMESFDVEIGRHLRPRGVDVLYFSGAIDEVRICTTARSYDWIRLSYINQRTNDLLVLFGN